MAHQTLELSYISLDRRTLDYILSQAKFEQFKRYNPKTKNFEGQGWGNKVMDIFSGPNNDVIGQIWRPIKHNYLYGFTQTKIVLDMYVRLKENPGSKELEQSLLTDIREVTGARGELKVIDYVSYVVHYGKNTTALIVGAFAPNMELEDRIFLVNGWWKTEAIKYALFNKYTAYGVPTMLLAQLFALGWKRTLMLWALGILVTEGASSTQDNLSGWSIITFMVYGQFIDEVIENPKQRTLAGGLRNLRGLTINALAGYGIYETGLNIWTDPTYLLLGKSQKTGVHHGLHHLGLLAGALLNRWSR